MTDPTRRLIAELDGIQAEFDAYRADRRRQSYPPHARVIAAEQKLAIVRTHLDDLIAEATRASLLGVVKGYKAGEKHAATALAALADIALAADLDLVAVRRKAARIYNEVTGATGDDACTPVGEQPPEKDGTPMTLAARVLALLHDLAAQQAMPDASWLAEWGSLAGDLARLRALAVRHAFRRHEEYFLFRTMHEVQADPTHAHPFETCPHADCALVRGDPDPPAVLPPLLAVLATPETTLRAGLQALIDENVQTVDGEPSCRVCEDDVEGSLHAPECPIGKLTALLAALDATGLL